MLTHVMSAIESFRTFLETQNFPDQFALRKKQLERVMNLFIIAPINAHQIKQVRSHHAIELYRIESTLAGEFADTYMNIHQKNSLRSIYDKFFAHIGVANPASAFKRVATVVFTEFVKGITFFEDELNDKAVPIYHRSVSCGVKTPPPIVRLTINNADSIENAQKKRAYLNKCYVERKIYDIIYNRVLQRQDVQHLNELQLIERLCFTQCDVQYISVSIDFKDYYPFILDIRYTRRNNTKSIIYKELYTKLHGTEKVLCKLFYNDVLMFDKIQTFNKEEAWIKSIENTA
jgi:hypothetical protein